MSIFFRNYFYFGLKVNIKVFLMSGTTYQSIAKASYFSFETAFFRSNPPKKSDNETVKKVHLLLYFVSSSVWFRILYLFCFSTLSDLTFLCHHPIKIFWVSCSSTFFWKPLNVKWLKSVFDTFDKFSIHQLLTCSKGPKKLNF